MSDATKPKSRLGRGLSSLLSVSDLPVEAEAPASSPAPQRAAPSTPNAQSSSPATPSNELPIDQIKPNPHQPRRQFNDAALVDLAASLRSNGLIQPVIVRKVENGYQLVAGERRLRAAKLAGFTTIPAIVRDIDSFSQAQLALVENIHREDLNPMDRAAAYKALIVQLGLTQSELSTRLGEDRATIANFLRLNDLAEPVKSLIRDGRLSVGHAKVLAGVPDILDQERLANLAVSQDLSVRNLERLIQLPAPEENARTNPPVSAHIQELEKTFARQLGMRVQIRSSGKRGRVIIHYASLDQFDQLQEKLGVPPEAT